MNEDVMVVETALLRPFFTAALVRDHTNTILDLIAANHVFIPRAKAEVSPEWKQIIPYVVIRHGDEYFVLQRTAKQTESRLHHKVSLGIGGHINPGHSLMEGLRKELDEEVAVDTAYDLRFVGILNDDSTDVGRVHLGAVYVLDAGARSVTVKETEKMTSRWMPRAELKSVREAMESWSQIVYDEFVA
jgi:predicted NUDIX family phosphoesterase